MSISKIDSDTVFAGGCVLGMFVIAAAAFVGWVLNIAKLVADMADPISLLTLLRIAGIPFFPLGCVLGWF